MKKLSDLEGFYETPDGWHAEVVVCFQCGNIKLWQLTKNNQDAGNFYRCGMCMLLRKAEMENQRKWWEKSESQGKSTSATDT